MPLDQLVTENGVVGQKLLRRNTNEDFEYDVIVIGSGMGGGVVASALADEEKKFLELEAGSLLFPTHVGNLPRRLLIGKFQKHIWSLWDDFRVINHTNAPGSEYSGGQGFNLGGRSILWGSSIPPLAKWELASWPIDIARYLLDNGANGGYNLANGVFNSTEPELGTFHTSAVASLQGRLGADWSIVPAPVAIEYAGPTEWSIPAGIFSTADLLLEDVLAIGDRDNPEGRQPLTVNLNHALWSVNLDGNKATGVKCFDLMKKKERNYLAKVVVISAGCLESAKIALTSGIVNEHIGRGITDHPIWYRHFVIPPEKLTQFDIPSSNAPRKEPASTKLLIRHKVAGLRNHGFDIILELGAQLNQGRFVDRDFLEDDIDVRGGYMLCELVFQFYSDLIDGEDGNTVTLGSNDPDAHGAPVRVKMRRAAVDPGLLAQARAVATDMFALFDAEPVLGDKDWPELQEAGVGGVAHEVGTLRMPIRAADGTTKKGVVDTDLKFEGFENLYACDNSVFPCSPAGNPSLTLVALARRLASKIAEELNRNEH